MKYLERYPHEDQYIYWDIAEGIYTNDKRGIEIKVLKEFKYKQKDIKIQKGEMKSKHTIIPMFIFGGLALVILIFAIVFEYRAYYPSYDMPKPSFEKELLEGMNEMIKVEKKRTKYYE